MSETTKRKLRQAMQNKENSSSNVVIRFFLLTLFIFLAIQLSINAILSPMGRQLEAFNVEKTRLLEENRSLEQNLANMGSIKALTHLSSKKLSLTQVKSDQVVYVSDTTVRAER